ncbi:MAG: phosphoribosylglycinamide formyltransferase [Desulfobacterales bacterium]
MGEKIRIGALISGSGTNLQAVIDACESGAIAGTVVFVGSDNPYAKGLARAEKHAIPTFVVHYRDIIRGYREDTFTTPPGVDIDAVMRKQRLLSPRMDARKMKTFFSTRITAEACLLEEMAAYPFDLLVLAGFMRNVTPFMIDAVNGRHDVPRIMNIHPALLPAFPGVDGYGDTFRYGCKVGGCTVHFVDYGEDSGPIIGQKAFPILPDDSLDSVKKKGLELEWKLYPECIQLFAENRLRTEKRVHDLGGGKVFERTVVKILSPETSV